jgi:hypothetical protein
MQAQTRQVTTLVLERTIALPETGDVGSVCRPTVKRSSCQTDARVWRSRLRRIHAA